MVRLLDDAPSRTNIRRYVATLKKQIDSLSCLIEDLLLAFRTDSERMTITRKPMYLTRLGVDCEDGPRALCNHEIIALYPPDQRVPVFGDETRLRQIFTNLLRNASTYTPHGKKIWIDIRSV